MYTHLNPIFFRVINHEDLNAISAEPFGFTENNQLITEQNSIKCQKGIPRFVNSDTQPD